MSKLRINEKSKRLSKKKTSDKSKFKRSQEAWQRTLFPINKTEGDCLRSIMNDIDQLIKDRQLKKTVK